MRIVLAVVALALASVPAWGGVVLPGVAAVSGGGTWWSDFYLEVGGFDVNFSGSDGVTSVGVSYSYTEGYAYILHGAPYVFGQTGYASYGSAFIGSLHSTSFRFSVGEGRGLLELYNPQCPACEPLASEYLTGYARVNLEWLFGNHGRGTITILPGTAIPPFPAPEPSAILLVLGGLSFVTWRHLARRLSGYTVRPR